LSTFLLGWLADCRRDSAFCARNGRLRELPFSALVRLQQRRAKLAGFREGWKFYGRDKSGPDFAKGAVAASLLPASPPGPAEPKAFADSSPSRVHS